VRQTYEVDGRIFSNLIAERRGEGLASEILLLGAHYDTHQDSPGANDNGSAIAAVLELAREARDWRITRTLRFVLFTNEESPFTRTEHMGSLIYAQACRANNERIAGMLCLETLGCYSEEVGSQWLSFGGLFLPRQGDFLAIVSDRASRPLLCRVTATLRTANALRFQALNLPRRLPGARSSDHWSFWMNGFQAVMMTDTAPLRYRHYHSCDDTSDMLNFDRLVRVVAGLVLVVGDHRIVDDVRELKSLARQKTPVAKIAKSLKRTSGATQQKAFRLGVSLDSRE
jgi:Zn-dependent M28 family amino/carboxypeptidase